MGNILKPCPLCGREVQMYRDAVNDGTVVFVVIGHGPHVNCGIRFTGLDKDNEGVNQWNTRQKEGKNVAK